MVVPRGLRRKVAEDLPVAGREPAEIPDAEAAAQRRHGVRGFGFPQHGVDRMQALESQVAVQAGAELFVEGLLQGGARHADRAAEVLHPECLVEALLGQVQRVAHDLPSVGAWPAASGSDDGLHRMQHGEAEFQHLRTQRGVPARTGAAAGLSVAGWDARSSSDLSRDVAPLSIHPQWKPSKRGSSPMPWSSTQRRTSAWSIETDSQCAPAGPRA